MDHVEIDIERLKRALAQQFVSLSRAGLSQMGRVQEPLDLTPFLAQETSAPNRATPVVETPRTEVPVEKPAPALFPKGDVTPSTLSRSEREHQLEELAKQVAVCVRCQELADTRTQTVFGVGNPEAKILFLGEAPGADEDRLGEPFVGMAGQLLDRIIQAATLTREDLYICNILRCRPPSNRNPTEQEAANCRDWLNAQIAIVDPDYIVCWGSIAVRNLLATNSSVGKLRGKFHTYGRAKVLCTYHPSYLLRYEPAKKMVWEDMKFLMSDMGVELGKK